MEKSKALWKVHVKAPCHGMVYITITYNGAKTCSLLLDKNKQRAIAILSISFRKQNVHKGGRQMMFSKFSLLAHARMTGNPNKAMLSGISQVLAIHSFSTESVNCK